MAASSSWVVRMRRLSVFYFFLLAAGGLLVVYYFYVTPNNKEEINERSARILRTLVYNFQKQKAGLDSIFWQQDLKNNPNWRWFKNKDQVYKLLYDNIHYEVKKGTPSPNTHDYIRYYNGWKMVFPIPLSDSAVQVPVQEFAERLFAARSDVFDSYILLLTDTTKPEGGKTGKSLWHLLYKDNSVTGSEQLLLDTADKLFRNSDMSVIIDATIGGSPQKLFLQSFNMDLGRLAIGGIISKSRYEKSIHEIPVAIIINAIVLFILIVIILPLLKIYFLSSNETIYSRDVLACSASLFMGTSALLLILIFSYLYFVSEYSYHNRMNDIGNSIKADIEKQLKQASLQLDDYLNCYDSLDKKQLSLLKQPEDITGKSSGKGKVDSIFYPKCFPDFTRILWVNSSGETIAKWSPYNYITPLTTVREHVYFNRLKAMYEHRAPKEDLIVYTGKSNLTDEFGVYIAKPIDSSTWDRSKGMDTAIGIVLVTSLHCNIYPVLPPGFGFCIVDDKGNVLLHSDNRRNLSENLFSETRYDPKVVNSIRLKTGSLLRSVQLYGLNHDLMVKPLKDQPLAIVIFFEKSRIVSNISRFLHFTIACLLFLFVSVIIYVLGYTVQFSSPSRLKFRIHKVEWIRPSAGNKYSYHFTQSYYLRLLVTSSLFFLLVQWLDLDMRIILYVSFLLPLYTLIGFVLARMHLVPRGESNHWFNWPGFLKECWHYFRSFFDKNLEAGPFPYKKTVRTFMISLLLLIFYNGYFLHFSINKEKETGQWITILLLLALQLIFIGCMAVTYKRAFQLLFKDVHSPEKKIVDDKKVPRNYLLSLYWALLLVSVLPTFGISAYAFFSEKMQFKKEKELYIASRFEAKSQFLKTQFRSSYSPLINNYYSKAWPVDSLFRQGVYLSDNDMVQTNSLRNEALVSGKPSNAVYDEPYRSVINHMYQYTSPYFGEFAIPNHSSDEGSSWEFYTDKNSLSLFYKSRTPNIPEFSVRSFYQNPLKNFFSVPAEGSLLFLLIILLFLYAAYRLISSVMNRLFLLHLLPPKENERYLERFFAGISKDNWPCLDTDKPTVINGEFFEKEDSPDLPEGQQEFILQRSNCLAPVYQTIWMDQSEKEKYILFDLARDGYTNYKNADIIYRLLTKGILIYKGYKLRFFSLSFRNFVLEQKDSKEMQTIKKDYEAGGMWRAVRGPLLLAIGGLTIFFLLTQSQLVHDATAFISSLLALVPLLIQLLGKSGSSRSEA